MPEIKSVFDNFQSKAKTSGEKIISIWQKPISSIQFPVLKRIKTPVKKESETQVAVRNSDYNKPVKRDRQSLISTKPVKKPLIMQKPYPERRLIRGIFTLTQNKEEFEKILFVLKACNKYSDTAYTNVLHIEKADNGSKLVATDGKRMHVAEIETRIKPGDYKPLVTRDAIKLGIPLNDVHFPNWEKVVPRVTAKCGIINLENTTIGKAQNTSREKSRVYDSFVKQTGERVNPNYLEDLTKKQWVIYRQSEKQKPILLKEDGAKMPIYAVVVPLAA